MKQGAGREGVRGGTPSASGMTGGARSVSRTPSRTTAQNSSKTKPKSGPYKGPASTGPTQPSARAGMAKTRAKRIANAVVGPKALLTTGISELSMDKSATQKPKPKKPKYY